ncbi:MAG: hypothetical protein IT353_22025 [Gemmatimonadaceae bacterium]|nr:hypothetical protein [Gemmatimonadaceae bacterium]
MTRFSTSRRFATRAMGLAAVFTATTVAMAPAATPTPPAAGGLTFMYKVTSSSTEKGRREATNVNARVRMQGGNARMDYVEGKGPMGQKGAYILLTSSPAQFSIVNDKDKQVMVMDPTLLGSGFGALMDNPLMKLTIKNSKFSYRDMGAGESVLGYKTRRVMVYNSAETEMKIIGMTRRSSSSDSSEQLVAVGMNADIDEASLAAWGKSFTSGLKATNPELAAEFAKYEKDYGRTGMVLKSTTWSTMTDNKGKVTTDMMTMEVTELTKGAIDPSVFAIPANYSVMNLNDLKSQR